MEKEKLTPVSKPGATSEETAVQDANKVRTMAEIILPSRRLRSGHLQNSSFNSSFDDDPKRLSMDRTSLVYLY